MLLAALNRLVPIGVLVAAIDNRVFNAGGGEWLGMYVGVGGFVLSQVVDRQQHPEIARNTLQKKELPKRQLFFNYFSSNEWITTPERSFGSNQVVFGGMMLPVSAILMSCCIETG